MKQDDIDDEFSRRVSSARAAKAMTQVELASKTGVSQRQIAAYEGAQSKPRKGVLLKLAKSLGVTPEWLARGFHSTRSNEPSESVYVASVSTKTFIPVITLGMLSDWMISPTDCCEYGEDYLTSSPVSDKAFAIRNNDAAMASSDADGYGFPMGSIIVFDPCLTIEDGDFVIALFESGKAIFRQYLTGLGESTLSPLNSRYPTESFENNVIDSDVTLIAAVHVEYVLPSAERLNSIQYNKS